MTDTTTKDLVKELLAQDSAMTERGFNMPVLRKAAAEIERLTASAPVDGDLREKIARLIDPESFEADMEQTTPTEREILGARYERGRIGAREKAETILALPSARTPQPVKDDLFIFVNEVTTINVSEYYRMKGYQKLPPLLTLTGGEIKKVAGYDPAYFVSCDDPWNDFSRDKAVADSEGVPLIAGMRFNIFPPAISRGGENCRPQHPQAEITWAEVHLRYSRRDWSAEVWGAARTPEPDADVVASAGWSMSTHASPGSYVELHLNDSPVGSGVRRFLILEADEAWVRLLYIPTLTQFKILRGEYNTALRARVFTTERELTRRIKDTREQLESSSVGIESKWTDYALEVVRSAREPVDQTEEHIRAE